MTDVADDVSVDFSCFIRVTDVWMPASQSGFRSDGMQRVAGKLLQRKMEDWPSG